MFRIFKKFYFKLYHLLKLLGVFAFFFIVSLEVNALETVPFQSEFLVAEESCSDNLFYPVLVDEANMNNNNSVYVQNSIAKTSYLIPIKSSTTYHIQPNYSSFGDSYVFYFADTSSTPISNTRCYATLNCTLNTPSNANYLAVNVTSRSYGDISTINIMLNEGSTGLNYVAFETCSPPEPPTPPETESSTIMTSFISLFLDRFSYLVEGFTTNSYLFIFISIIVVFAILYILLKLFHLRGGRFR